MKTSMHHRITRRRFVGAALTGVAAWTGRQALLAASADPLQQGCIDAHVHVWTPDTERYKLKPGFAKAKMNPPSFTPEQLFAHCRPVGVDRIVLVQMSFYGDDNSYMLEMMRRHPGVFSGIALIDGAAQPRQAMLELKTQGVRGFRVAAVSPAADARLDSPEMAEMWKCAADEQLAICLLIGATRLEWVARMCARFPRTPVVVDHMARIGFDGQIRDAEVDALCRLAQHAMTNVKVSAFYALGRRKSPYEDLGPMIRRLRDAFGPERLMWGSDSPFQVAAPHIYRDSVELVRTRLDFLSPADRLAMLRKTAERLFF